MKVNEIKEQLMDKFGVNSLEIKGKKKEELQKMLDKFNKTDEIFKEEEKDEIPDITSPEWTPYVISLFEQNELENNAPRVDALRRVATMLLGDYDFDVEVVQPPSTARGIAVVKATLRFVNTGRVVSSVSDVSKFNTDDAFSIYSTSTAETRSEGRALRKALKLNRIIAAEEMRQFGNGQTEQTISPIPDSVVNGIKILAKQQKIDPFKMAILFNSEVESMEDLTLSDGHDIMRRLNEYRNQEEEIPNNIKV